MLIFLNHLQIKNFRKKLLHFPSGIKHCLKNITLLEAIKFQLKRKINLFVINTSACSQFLWKVNYVIHSSLFIYFHFNTLYHFSKIMCVSLSKTFLRIFHYSSEALRSSSMTTASRSSVFPTIATECLSSRGLHLVLTSILSIWFKPAFLYENRLLYR